MKHDAESATPTAGRRALVILDNSEALPEFVETCLLDDVDDAVKGAGAGWCRPKNAALSCSPQS